MRLSGTALDIATSIAHLAFGGAAGGVYSLVTMPAGPVRAGPRFGYVYGALIWAMAYLGVLPRLRLVSRPGQGGWTREVVMLAAHLVYGGVLGQLARGGQDAAARA
jgi:putative membrane protein